MEFKLKFDYHRAAAFAAADSFQVFFQLYDRKFPNSGLLHFSAVEDSLLEIHVTFILSQSLLPCVSKKYHLLTEQGNETIEYRNFLSS